MKSKILAGSLCAAMCWAMPSVLHAAVGEARTIDGSGNNLSQPDWGAANTRLLRLASQAFYPGDGSGGEMMESPDRPNPRTISNGVAAESGLRPNNRTMSDFVWMWGQFLDHDLGLTTTDPSSGTAPIEMEDSEDVMGTDPMGFTRSVYDHATGTSGSNPRQQINQITSYIDGSQVYGSDATTAASLRTFSGGRMAISDGNLLPFGAAPGRFVAGDIRVNENVNLSSMHTLFVREHNRLAGLLAVQNPGADDEEIYQAARKIVGAELQIITYNEFLPAVMGGNAPSAADVEYDEAVPASMANEFAHAAYRFGHSMLSPNLQMVENSGASAGQIALRDAFENPGFLVGGPHRLDLLLKGAATQRAQEIDNQIVDDVRNFLFGPPGAGGFDLATLNIQRGRDHGLPDYNTLRGVYGLDPVIGFEEITSNEMLQEILAELYGDVDNIDPWVGVLAEDHLPGTSVGELLATALRDQFTRLRDGDRFFYLQDPDLYLADGSLRTEIAGIVDLNTLRLSDVIHFNTGVTNLQRNVFFVPEPGAAVVLGVASLSALWVRRRSRR